MLPHGLGCGTRMIPPLRQTTPATRNRQPVLRAALAPRPLTTVRCRSFLAANPDPRKSLNEGRWAAWRPPVSPSKASPARRRRCRGHGDRTLLGVGRDRRCSFWSVCICVMANEHENLGTNINVAAFRRKVLSEDIWRRVPIGRGFSDLAW